MALLIEPVILIPGNICMGNVEAEPMDKIVKFDNKLLDPRLCVTIDCDIYNNLRASEVSFTF